MRALEGVRVVDLSRFVAGPFCCQILGDQEVLSEWLGLGPGEIEGLRAANAL